MFWIILTIILTIPCALIAALLIYRFFILRPQCASPANTYRAKPKYWTDKLIGQVYRLFIENNGNALREWQRGAEEEGKDVISFQWTPGLTAVIPLHEEDLHFLLCGEGSQYVVKHKDYKKLGGLLGNSGLITITDPKEHAQQRRLVAPAFSQKTVTNTANFIIPKHSANLHKEIRKGLTNTTGGLRLNKYFDRFALDIIVEGSFSTLKTLSSGIEIGPMFEKMMATVSASVGDFLPSFISTRLPSERNRVFDQYRPQIWSAADEMAEKSRKQQEAGEIRPGQETVIDFLSREKNLSQQQLRDHLLHLLAAGHETSSKALTWAAIYLSRSPRVQQKLLEELEETVALNASPSLDDLKNCAYLDNVIKEALRLSPPAPQVGRETTRDLILPHSKVQLPAGIRVLFSMYLIHRRRETYGEDRNEFRPERWEDPKLIEKQEKYGTIWMPFLPPTHSRNCIGSGSAMATLRVGLAALVRSFKLSWPDDQDFPKMKWKVTLMPVPDPQIILESRTE